MRGTPWTLDDVNSVCSSISTEGFRGIGEALEAFWEDLRQPGELPYHAIMVSKKHTNGFVNVSTYMAETHLAQILATQLIVTMQVKPGDVDVIVAPGIAAITLGYEVARQLRCRAGFTEKDDDGRTTKIGGRMRIRPGERVLVINELMSTADGSTLQTRAGVLRHQPEAQLLDFAGVLVNRSGLDSTGDGIEVRSRFKFAMETWQPDYCPHCAAGSKAIKPKLTQLNWELLTGKKAA